MLQRMNELATQAANGTNSKDSDRQAIEDEIDQLTTEIDRVSETTKFNETYLLKGEAGTKTINMKAHDAGLKGILTDNGDGTATFVMDSLKDGDSVNIGGKTYKIGSTEQAAKNLIAKSVDVEIGDQKFKIKSDGEVQNANGDKLYIKTADGSATAATTFTSYTTDSQFTNDKGAKVANTALSVTNLKSLVKGGVTVKVGNDTAIAMTDTAGGAADGVDDNDATLITRQKVYELAGKELLAANSIGDTENHVAVTNGNGEVLAFDKGDGSFKISVGQAKVANSLSFSLHVGADADMTNKINVNIDSMDSASLGIKGLNIKDDSGNAATYAVDAISDVISKVSSQRSSLGAVQNRLEHTINNLDNVVENTTTAESRIRDTDMAEEMVNYSKNNILAQAGQSMLAQANQSNQGVLSLLQ